MATPTSTYLRSIKLRDLLTVGGTIGCYLAIAPTSLAATTIDRIDLIAVTNSHRASTLDRSERVLIAGANNFNPELTLRSAPPQLPPQLPYPSSPPLANPTVETAQKPDTSAPTTAPIVVSEGQNVDASKKPAALTPNATPLVVLEGLQPDIRNDWNNSGQVNRTIEQTAIFRLNNGDRATVKTGYDTYEQPGSKTATNIPVQVGWETKINSLKVQPTVGVDFLDVSTTPNFSLKVDYPLTTGLTVSADIQQGAYKFNAKTIENQISALRYGPSIFWTIDPNTTLFSSLHFGNYSDGNAETQSFTRLERKFGEFSLAANLFTWGYQNPTDKGYFAPADFIVYTGEVAWEGDVIANLLKCRLSAPLGGQRVNGSTSDAGGYQTKCTAKISPNIEVDLGYVFSNVKNQATGLSTANSQSLGTQVRIKF